MTVGLSSRVSARVLCLTLLSAPLGAARADITEDFSSPAAAGPGSTLGACNQLKVGLSGAGSITVPGTGVATVSTPAAADAAMLYSTQALPATYKVTAVLGKIDYPQYTLENGVTLLAISDTTPQAAGATWWGSHRVVAVEVAVTPGASNQYPIYVNYFDSTTLYTWNGTSWGAGDPAWVPVITFDPTKSYKVSIQKTASSYIVTVSTGTTQLTQATVPVASVLPATTERFVIGDRLTDYFRGSLQVHSVTQPTPPGCALDAGMPDTSTADAGPADGPLPDSAPPDAAAPIDAATTDRCAGTRRPAGHGQRPGRGRRPGGGGPPRRGSGRGRGRRILGPLHPRHRPGDAGRRRRRLRLRPGLARRARG
jgi:hypothetical protein